MKTYLYRFQKFLLSLLYSFSRLMGVKLPPFASASGLIIDQDKILVVNISYKKGYALPGGLLEPGESFEQALIRETKEETNLDIEITSFVDHFHSYDQFPTINALYTAKIVGGKLKSSDEGKVSWKKPEEVVNNMAYSDNQEALRRYFNL